MNPFGFVLQWLDRRIALGIEAQKRLDKKKWEAGQPERDAAGDRHIKALVDDGLLPVSVLDHLGGRPAPSLQ
jgi:hypothetical protein